MVTLFLLLRNTLSLNVDGGIVNRSYILCVFTSKRAVIDVCGFLLTCETLLEEQCSVPFILFNLLEPTGYVMHQQFNIQQLYVLPTLYLCVLYLSENKQRLVLLTA